MNSTKFRVGTLLLLLFASLPSQVQAQDQSPGQPPAAPAAVYSQAQIDQLLAPVALYPDALVGEILMASTYPLEVVEASRWLQNPNNAGLSGDQLTAALEQQPWDPSVKSLVTTPQVLHMMDSNIQWTEQLGSVFLAQQPAVADSIQRLRQEARATGALTSTPQQVVEAQGSNILIEPANPDVVYVPAYNPMVIYGSWPYASYPPYSFYPAGYGFGASLIGFGVGIAVVDAFWGWHHWDWSHHRIDIDDRRFSELNRGRPPVAAGVWEHNPEHRGGVPYRDAATRARFQGQTTPEVNRAYRGYETRQATPQANRPVYAGVNRPDSRPQTIRPANVSAAPAIQRAPAETQQYRPQTIRPAVAAPVQQRAAAPMFESFSRGPDVRAQSARGNISRASAPAPAAVHNSPRPASGGGRNEHR